VREEAAMQQITTFLMFEGKAEEAMNFYTSLFPNSKVLAISRFGASEEGPEGTVRHATFSLNGQDVSSGLTVTGPTQSRKIQYQHLQANQVYRGEMIVADQEGRSSTNRFFFDTFVDGAARVIEAEDYNFGSGQHVPAASVMPYYGGAYSNRVGVLNVDYFNNMH